MKTAADKILLFSVLTLVLIGIVVIATTSNVISQKNFGTNYHYFIYRLILGIIPGLALMAIIFKIDFHFWKKKSFLIFLFSLILLILVFIPPFGIKLNEARRWVDFGFFSFQPGEFFKISLIIYLASIFSSGKLEPKSFLRGFLPLSVLLGAISFIFIKQPNIGTLVIILIVSGIMFFYAGAKIRHILLFGLLGILSLAMLIKTEPYRFNRFAVFMHPELDPEGIGYQINQARLAIGSGGLFGLGIGQSRQKHNYLPEPMTDSIFAVFAEETGFFGVGILIFLFGLIGWRGFLIARNSSDNFGSLCAVGIVSLILTQTLLNIMALVGLMPLTGIPFPFISYGNSSIVSLLAGVGLLLNISKNSKVVS